MTVFFMSFNLHLTVETRRWTDKAQRGHRNYTNKRKERNYQPSFHSITSFLEEGEGRGALSVSPSHPVCPRATVFYCDVYVCCAGSLLKRVRTRSTQINPAINLALPGRYYKGVTRLIFEFLNREVIYTQILITSKELGREHKSFSEILALLSTLETHFYTIDFIRESCEWKVRYGSNSKQVRIYSCIMVITGLDLNIICISLFSWFI